MKYIGMIILFGICAVSACATPKASDIPPEYVCTNRFFAVPESFDMSNVDQARLLVRANPKRFEAHLMLASALLANKRIEDAISEFRVVDELASKVEDQAVLSGVMYEDLYAFALFIAAEQRYMNDANDLHTLRMLQQVIGMDHSKLEEKRLLPRCYAYIATLYVKRGAYDSSIRSAQIGHGIAKQNKDTDSMEMLDMIISRARELKKERDSQQKSGHVRK